MLVHGRVNDVFSFTNVLGQRINRKTCSRAFLSFYKKQPAKKVADSDEDSSDEESSEEKAATKKPAVKAKRVMKEPGSSNKTSFKSKVSGHLKIDGMTRYMSISSNIMVQVGRSDITKLPVDAVVNAANSRLNHVGGQSKHRI